MSRDALIVLLTAVAILCALARIKPCDCMRPFAKPSPAFMPDAVRSTAAKGSFTAESTTVCVVLCRVGV